jgi:uncharacterized protein (DUF305 family)
MSSMPSASVHNAEDTSFTQLMMVHHEGAITMADLAPTRASSTAVKDLAATIKAEQQPQITLMKGWLKTWGEPATAPTPTPMPSSSSMPGMGTPSAPMSATSMPGMTPEDMAMLTAATGAAFDKMFLSLMIEHHQSAVTMAKTELAGGNNAAAKKLASSIVASQTKQIATMKTMLTSLGG